jgi:hypothetical protein
MKLSPSDFSKFIDPWFIGNPGVVGVKRLFTSTIGHKAGCRYPEAAFPDASKYAGQERSTLEALTRLPGQGIQCFVR